MDKQCSKCQETKPLALFYKQKWCALGVRPECKACSYKACRDRFDPTKHRVYTRRYRSKNPTKDREYYEKNKAILIPKMVEYNRKNRDAYNAKLRKWRKENPDKVQVWVRNRRARVKGLIGSHTIQDILDLMKSQKGLCVYCRCDIKKKYQVDHITPVSAGGRNDKQNLQLLCKQCNLDKRAKDPAQFAQERGLLV